MHATVFQGFWRSLLPVALLFGSACAREEQPDISVILISPDSLRVDRLSPWNTSAPSNGNIERLAQRGTVYLNTWATSPWTAPSMVSIFSGLYPPAHGVAYRDDTTPRDLATLPRLLAERGYHVGNFSFFSQLSYFRNLGLGSAVPKLKHTRVTTSFEQWLGELQPDQPFFAWVHLLQTHLPYGATGYRATELSIAGSTGLEESQLSAVVPIGSVEFEDGDRESLVELYDRDVAKLDEAIGRLIDALESSGRLDQTLVIFVADHGEELLDEAWVGHASTAIDAKFLPQILRVPMILAGPGVQSGEVVHDLVQPVDLLPTLARWLNLDLPAEIDGQRLPGARSFFDRSRQFAYFDSSPGGNLTPVEDRDKRLQGVTDGRCLLEVRSRPGQENLEVLRSINETACDATDQAALNRELESWRARQAATRMTLLSSTVNLEAPSSEEIDSYEETMQLLEPHSGQVLSHRETGGLISLAWTGESDSFWVEYELGGATAPRGTFGVEQNRVVFGPVPPGFWNDIASYSPIRIRAVDSKGQKRSPWVQVEIAEAK